MLKTGNVISPMTSNSAHLSLQAATRHQLVCGETSGGQLDKQGGLVRRDKGADRGM